MRQIIGSTLVTLAVVGTIAAVKLASGGDTASSANVASVRHHLGYCAVCRESGLTVSTLSRGDCPSPCSLDGRGCTLGPASD